MNYFNQAGKGSAVDADLVTVTVRLPKSTLLAIQEKFASIEEVADFQVPKKYLSTLEAVLSYLDTPATAAPISKESRLKFFIESDPQFWPKHNFIPFFSKKLAIFPQAPIYVSEDGLKRFELNRGDLEIILSYPFILNQSILSHVLQRLGVLSCKGKPFPSETVYKWKFVEPFYWDARFEFLLATYFPQYNQGRRKNMVLEFVTCRLLAGGYDSQLADMRSRIEANHQ